MPTDLGDAIDIMHRALQCDTRKNYTEALKLYEIGIEHFLDALHHEVEGETARAAIVGKCRVYCERAEELRQTINRVKGQKEEDKSQFNEKHLPKAIEILTQALQDDKKCNYRDALRHYQQGLYHYDIVIGCEILSDKFKEALQTRRKVYAERISELKEKLNM